MTSISRKQHHEELYDYYGGPKKVEYARLAKRRYYLPPINSPAVSRQYILDVKEGLVISKLEREIIEYGFAHFSKEVAFCVLKEVAQEEEGLGLGFDITQMPPKAWMVNMAFAIQPDHRAFVSDERFLELGRIAMDPVRWSAELQAAISQLPTAAELYHEYRPVIVAEYKSAIRRKLHILAKRYKFCTVNPLNPLIN